MGSSDSGHTRGQPSPACLLAPESFGGNLCACPAYPFPPSFSPTYLAAHIPFQNAPSDTPVRSQSAPRDAACLLLLLVWNSPRRRREQPRSHDLTMTALVAAHLNSAWAHEKRERWIRLAQRMDLLFSVFPYLSQRWTSHFNNAFWNVPSRV